MFSPSLWHGEMVLSLGGTDGNQIFNLRSPCSQDFLYAQSTTGFV